MTAIYVLAWLISAFLGALCSYVLCLRAAVKQLRREDDEITKIRFRAECDRVRVVELEGEVQLEREARDHDQIYFEEVRDHLQERLAAAAAACEEAKKNVHYVSVPAQSSHFGVPEGHELISLSSSTCRDRVGSHVLVRRTEERFVQVSWQDGPKF